MNYKNQVELNKEITDQIRDQVELWQRFSVRIAISSVGVIFAVSSGVRKQLENELD